MRNRLKYSELQVQYNSVHLTSSGLRGCPRAATSYQGIDNYIIRLVVIVLSCRRRQTYHEQQSYLQVSVVPLGGVIFIIYRSCRGFLADSFGVIQVQVVYYFHW